MYQVTLHNLLLVTMDYLSRLPKDISALVVMKLDVVAATKLRGTNKYFRNLVQAITLNKSDLQR